MHYTLEIFISPSIRIDLHSRHWEPITCTATLLAPGEELSLVSIRNPTGALFLQRAQDFPVWLKPALIFQVKWHIRDSSDGQEPPKACDKLAQRSGRAKDPAPVPQAGEHTPHTVSSPGQRCAHSTWQDSYRPSPAQTTALRAAQRGHDVLEPRAEIHPMGYLIE